MKDEVSEQIRTLLSEKDGDLDRTPSAARIFVSRVKMGWTCG
jgi:hypothetical protein